MIPPIAQLLSSINQVVQKEKRQQAKGKEKKQKEQTEQIINKQNQFQ